MPKHGSHGSGLFEAHRPGSHRSTETGKYHSLFFFFTPPALCFVFL
jgi:hypothetical protein